ncbi:SulP family inorganic anion transporter [Holdemanella biformis]|uniref:SulP family inorganic anion transporter n=1 Tax=Holdemanella biformis TaxID=1735 RepID=UPI001C3861E9|nr:SulP family inorganic anion transporter [Holdemanella biformis]MBV4131995.1 STAS domain-containing protein [Holdemanella biformis]MBV4151746.1 STAS domain-containing protein [Holdemanella biformis]MEE0668085.1 SulP family inorganic anion transporter [Holdemanella biformis]
MNSLKPMLLSSLKSYDKSQFVKDVTAGIIVAIIALPLSIALALASGVGPEAGIFTAIVAGFVISALGGSSVQIAGPTAAFATIVAGIVAHDGMDGLIVATILAGIFLILMGLCHFGSLIKFIPFTITTGFTSGIAVTIVIGQLKDFFGLTYPNGVKPIETVEKFEAVINNFSTINMDAVIVGGVSLAILIIAPYIFKRIPGSLLAVIAGILMVQFLPLKVNTIGNLYTISNALPSLRFPSLSLNIIQNALPNALTIAVLAAIESLLSCVVADGMINGKHRSDMELVAQGAGNIASALFGGIPATGAIARTAANIKNGGKTPIAGMVHSITLVIVLVVLMPYAGMIPMPTIAAILFIVAYNMCQWRTFVNLVKTAPKSDVIVLVTSFVLTVIFDLVVAIEVGMVLACLLFIKRMSEETKVNGWTYVDEDTPDVDEHLQKLPLQIRVYEISGPLFFGAASVIEEIVVKDFTNCLVLRMRSVPALDSTALNALKDLVQVCKSKGITIVFSHVNDQPMKVMEKAGFIELVGKVNFQPSISAALDRAEEIIHK